MQFLYCNQRLGDVSPEERRDEAHYISLLKVVETFPGLYFSYDADLTRTAQAATMARSELHRLPLHQQAESRFLWNEYLLQEFTNSKLDPFIVPIIQGNILLIQFPFFFLRSLYLSLSKYPHNRSFKEICTRMWRRGADSKGNAANFVETEQILEAEDFVFSYVQIRGSIPILWEQIVDLTYNPTITDLNHEETPKVVEQHFEDLYNRYGDVVAVDLINQQGPERVLSVAFAKAMESISSDSIRYVPFDFHHICGQLDFTRLDTDLYPSVAEDLSKQSFFMKNSEEVLQKQEGVLRTNCIDCLDRTNVTQSMFGRKVLEVQLIKLNLFQQSEKLEQHQDLDKEFKRRTVWADNGDDISMQYAGTPALKGDFVRGISLCLWSVVGRNSSRSDSLGSSQRAIIL
uniref:SAC domain-containing protein n=1 Tax=Physcomitrium patens TaxID=3218 RepID=A0A2K1K6H6_PHYPA|nr:hypothetical protein PHYPA_011277 [Physcomitrium patens]